MAGGGEGAHGYRDGAREMQVRATGATAKQVQERAGPAAPAEGSVAELRGRLAELEAELERTRGPLHQSGAERDIENSL